MCIGLRGILPREVENPFRAILSGPPSSKTRKPLLLYAIYESSTRGVENPDLRIVLLGLLPRCENSSFAYRFTRPPSRELRKTLKSVPLFEEASFARYAEKPHLRAVYEGKPKASFSVGECGNPRFACHRSLWSSVDNRSQERSGVEVEHMAYTPPPPRFNPT